MCILKDAWLATNPPAGGTIPPEASLSLIVLGYFLAQADPTGEIGPEARAILDAQKPANLSGILCPLTEAWCESEWIGPQPTTEGLRAVCLGYSIGLVQRDISKLGKHPFRVYLHYQSERKLPNVLL